MKVLAINLGNSGSTGNIAREIGECAVQNEVDFYFAYPDQPANKTQKKNEIIICKYIFLRFFRKFHYLTGYDGCFAKFITKSFLKKVDKIQPDIIHLHNIHNNYLNLKMLFDYIKNNNIKVLWTLHDCWSFTGRCPYFTLSNCQKWKKGCYMCEYPKEQYPSTRVDKTKEMWEKKKKWFTGVNDLVIVTPSAWLAELVKESYLHDYPIKIINNGIDLNIFKPQANCKLIQKNNSKFYILGVAFDWGFRKGLDVFVELSKRLDDRFQIVLVGTNETIDKLLPKNIISIHRTHNQLELAEIYSFVDLFVNPTREDNFPTVNMESLACGTPVLTFDTGGSPEVLDETCGAVVNWNDFRELEKEIIRICETKPYSKISCIQKAKYFDKDDCFREYVKLFFKTTRK